MDAPALMKKLGFGEYEARAYIALLQHGPGSGYSIARAAGIPRANVYGVLDKLVQRAAAQRYRSKRGMHYSPTPPDTLLDGIDEQHRAVMETAGQALRNLSAARAKAPAFSLEIGRASCRERCSSRRARETEEEKADINVRRRST